MKIKEVNEEKLKKMSLLDWILMITLIGTGVITYMADTLGLISIPIIGNSDNSRMVYGMTMKDKELMDVQSKFIEGRSNIDYLTNVMLSNKPYLEYYYKNIYDNPITSGWTINPNRIGITGRVRLVEPKYYGYKIGYDNDKIVEIKSPLVDNFMEIIDEYPYYDKYFCYTFVRTEFEINIEDIPSLTVDNIRHHIDAAEPIVENEGIKSL